METPSHKSEMDENLDLFLRSCFPSNWGEASWGVEIFRLRHLDEEHLNKAKAAILAGLERHEGRPISAALELNLTQAIPILKQWLQKNSSDKTQLGISGHLAYALYKLTKDESYTPILVDAVRNAGYSYDYPGGLVTNLGELPLTLEAFEVVWQRLVRGNVLKHPSGWRYDCIRFLRENINSHIGESFLKSLPEAEQKELLELISDAHQQQSIKQGKQFDKNSGFIRDEVNKFGEYVKVGGSPTKGMTLKHLWKGRTGKIQKLEWSYDGIYLASKQTSSGVEVEPVRIWDLNRGECIRELTHPKEHRFDRFEPDGIIWINSRKGLLAVGYTYSVPTSPKYRHKITMWDVENEKIISTILDNDEIITSGNRLISFSDGKMLLDYSGNTLYTIDITTGNRKEFHKVYSKPVVRIARSNVAISPDGNTLAIGRQTEIFSHEILLFDTKSNHVLSRINTGHILSISKVNWMPKQAILAVASEDNTISIWDLSDNRKVALLEGHAGVVTNLSFSANGELLASKSENDNLLIIWRTDTWQPVIKLKEICGYDTEIAFHPSLPILVSLCREEVKNNGNLPYSIRVWEFDYDLLYSNSSKYQDGSTEPS